MASPASLAVRIALLWVLTAKLLSGENTATEFWPEIDAVIGLRHGLRLVTSTKVERDVPLRNREYGVDLEWSARHFRYFRGGHLFEQDSGRTKRVSLRVGYRYKRSLGSEPQVSEHRPTSELILRWSLPADVLMSNRSRMEFRFVDGQFSLRYRDQIKWEKELPVHQFSISLYAAGEAFYDFSPKKWDRFRFTGGLSLPVAKWIAVEPYYTRQIATRSQPRNINVAGLILQFYIRN